METLHGHVSPKDIRKVGVERVGVPLAESSYFATFADSSCHYALSALVLALSAKIIQKVN